MEEKGFPGLWTQSFFNSYNLNLHFLQVGTIKVSVTAVFLGDKEYPIWGKGPNI